MNKLSIKFKIMLWFSSALIILVLIGYALNYYVSSYVLDQALKERLVTIVTSNVEEIEYHNSQVSVNNPHLLTLSYGDGKIEIDDNFCEYYEGVCTALIDSNNNLLYGESPISLPTEKLFKDGSIETVTYKGQEYFVYEKKLSGANLEGLWLRGVISEEESTYMIDTIWGIERWFLLMLAAIALIGGFAITTRAFLPIEKISTATDHIVSGTDLTKRIDIGPGKDEIHQLASTINDMLDRLERSFETEKQFTSDASHELRTPLSVIKAHTEFALEFAENEEDYKEALEIINRQSDKVTSLLSQLLFFTRLEQSNKNITLSEGNLSNFVESIFNDRAILLRDNREFVSHIEKDIIARYDESLLSRLINNLLDNAQKYSFDGSTIKLTLEETSTSIKLSVEDNGKGISSENLEKIWNRFYREDESRFETTDNSFGLGLSMVKEIASLHKGKIEVHSQLNVGSIFTLTLPK